MRKMPGTAMLRASLLLLTFSRLIYNLKLPPIGVDLFLQQHLNSNLIAAAPYLNFRAKFKGDDFFRPFGNVKFLAADRVLNFCLIKNLNGWIFCRIKIDLSIALCWCV